ncbi:MAG TPA: dipeptide/oligopeptide/nickel ABC transporter permease/ATP-binding protein [Solirubrobacteraceae bacterium]|nr:dipeptide/oligopeptide/nickel ABC transporter permease/ATP-binding protein [Solirubrobacteraceae bacterium]
MSVINAPLVGGASASAQAAEAAASRGIIRTILRSPRGVCAVAFLLLVIIACALAAVIAPSGPIVQDLSAVNRGPSSHHLLGTDALGRDLLSRLLYGGRSSLVGVAEAVLALLVISVPLGVVAGYTGGAVDRVITRTADLVMSIPVIIILLAVLAMFGRSMSTAMVALGVLGAAGVTRVVRSAALAVREEAFIAAAEVMGQARRDIIFRHILPQCRGVIVVQTSLFAAIALGVQTGLTYLSLGPAPPAPTWGGMVGDAVTAFYTSPWQIVPPGAAIALTVVAFGVLGDVVRDAIADTHSAGASGRPPHRARRPAPAAAPAEALVHVEGMSVAFGSGADETTVVQGVTFTVGAGEAVGIVGESGSGKTVTVKALAGLLPRTAAVTAGSISFAGTELSAGGRRAYRRVRGHGIAIVTQEPMRALDPTFRVGKLLADLVRAVDRCSRGSARTRALELLGRVQILDPEDVAQRYPHQISGGMAQRVAIAMALAGRPKLLIADEPTTALDVTVQAEILDLLRGLQRETGMALVLVSHDLGVVAEICSRVCVMYAGEIVEVAHTEELFAQPFHPYTRALLNASPGGRSDTTALEVLPGGVPSPRGWPIGCHFADRCAFAVETCMAAPVPLRPVFDADRQARCVRAEELAAPVEAAT